MSSRSWSKAEAKLAHDVATKIGLWGEGRIVGAYSIARAVGLTGLRVNMIHRVQGVMPLVREIVVEMYPGQRLLVKRDGPGAWIYSLTSDTNVELMRSSMSRVRAARTKLDSALAEIPVGLPEGRALAAFIGQSLTPLQEEIIQTLADAMRMKAEAEAAAKEGVA